MTNPHGRALRSGRWSEVDRIYLVTTATRDREPWFSDFHLGRHLVKALRNESGFAETLAYVVMPDHMHWLMRLRQGSMSHVVANVKAASAYAINRHLGRTGSLWQRGFYDHALRREEDLRAMARYIVANPLRAGLVENIGQYSLWDAIWL